MEKTLKFQDKKLGEVETRLNAFCSKTGDRIYDKTKHRIGDVVKEGQSGNYGLIYVNFHDGSNILRINPLDDAQRIGRFYKVVGDLATIRKYSPIGRIIFSLTTDDDGSYSLVYTNATFKEEFDQCIARKTAEESERKDYMADIMRATTCDADNLISGSKFLKGLHNGTYSCKTGFVCDIFVDDHWTNLGLVGNDGEYWPYGGRLLISPEIWTSLCKDHDVKVEWVPTTFKRPLLRYEINR